MSDVVLYRSCGCLFMVPELGGGGGCLVLRLWLVAGGFGVAVVVVGYYSFSYGRCGCNSVVLLQVILMMRIVVVMIGIIVFW